MKENESLSRQEEVSLKDQIRHYLQYWFWFILSLTICITIAFLNMRYSTYSYVSEATILIKDDKNASLSEIAIFEDLGLTGSALNKSQFENEIEILKSRRLLSEVVRKLKSNIRYFKVGSIKTSELYEDLPFKLTIFDTTNIDQLSSKSLIIKILSDTEFEIKEGEEGEVKKYSFNQPFKIGIGEVALEPNVDSDEFQFRKENFIVAIGTVDKAVNDLRRKIKVQSVSKNSSSSILKLTIISAQKLKAEATLDTLVAVYNKDAIYDRNLVSKNTADFIINRLEIITRELDSVETGKVDFKEKNRLTDIRAEGQLFLENASELNKKQIVVATQKELLKSMTDYIATSKDYTLLPSNLGIENGGVVQAVNEYNDLIIRRQRLLNSSTEENPIVIELSNQISQFKENVKENLNTVTLALDIEDRDIRKQINKIGGKISQIPSIAKSSRDIERQQTIKESLYLYLLQKREETAISLAVTTPKAKIVDKAYTAKEPVSPQPKFIYLVALIVGFAIPFVIIFIKTFFDTKIHNRVDVEKEVPSLPILGEIPVIDSKDSEVITNNDRSVLAEAFRILRTNLGYFINSKENGNVVFVTSTIKGEGKTFVAYNLAISLTSTRKSVLLIGADIRNPQIHRYIDENEWKIGLSEYLFDSSVDVNSITNKVDIEGQNFDVILSGRIPPNPAELLMSERFETIIAEVKDKYDYVIVDTAPTLLVTDTLLISQMADTTVYVCRAEYTDKKLLQYPKELYDEGKIKNIAFAINGIKLTNFGYGSKYGYGYGYGQEKPSVFSRLKRALKLKK
ncbi:tyrosine protein kinase [Dokdonia pacifica]|uniref:non-specific protein-tyrosine kinase n=1 Tax=Dokdonia pacifica TaxID=1627892 RepID=A0A238YM87_9FLAO|nr:tyrosine-protein kinase [Dokdonia pacifica]GGG11494.1 tyrosine protein kinase [Dokdonia pacifica]SNR71821.1 capsular exopolysaccharide family [Dokdonia pacifica]